MEFLKKFTFMPFLEYWRRQWQPTPVLLPGKSHGRRSLVGCSPWGLKSQTRLSIFTFTFHFHALEKEMATHSSVLAWRIPGMAEPGGLLSVGSRRVGHDWSDLAAEYVTEYRRHSPVKNYFLLVPRLFYVLRDTNVNPAVKFQFHEICSLVGKHR